MIRVAKFSCPRPCPKYSLRRALGGVTLSALVVCSSLALSPKNVRAAINFQLTLPSAAGTNISLNGGPHNWAGCTIVNGVLGQDCLGNHPWNSLDWAPADGKVYASHSGTAHIYDCPAVGGHRSFVRVDYNDGSGRQISYEHIHDVDLQVHDLQVISAGYYLGMISTDSDCGGSATGPHTHMSIWQFTGTFTEANSQAVDWNGIGIGSWILDDGSPTEEQYTGCITPAAGGARQCPTTTISNNGSTGTLLPLIADNGQYTFVAEGIHLRKYYDVPGAGGYDFLSGSDTTGLTGPGTHCANANSNYLCAGYYDMGTTITALAINSQYLYIGLENGRVIKTDMCATGWNVCGFADNLGLNGQTANWIGEESDVTLGPVTALAVNSSMLFMSYGTTTIKTTLCGTGHNMCTIYNGAGTQGGSYYYGYQQWAYPVIAQGANDSWVFTSLSGSGVDRVCETDYGTSGSDVLWLSSSTSPAYNCVAGNTAHWVGYEDMAAPVVGLSVGQYWVWWSITTPASARIIQTNMCASLENVCAFSPDKGYGDGSEAGWNDWQGRQDWCSGTTAAQVTSWDFVDGGGAHSVVSSTFATSPSLWRDVEGQTNNAGINLLTSDCSGISGASNWIGSQDLSF